MTQNHYDIVTVGGGIAASTFAVAMAKEGARVLVLERENEFKDRVRGEALVPWGVGEAQKLGIYDLMKQSCGLSSRGSMSSWDRTSSCIVTWLRQRPKEHRSVASTIQECKRC